MPFYWSSGFFISRYATSSLNLQTRDASIYYAVCFILKLESFYLAIPGAAVRWLGFAELYSAGKASASTNVRLPVERRPTIGITFQYSVRFACSPLKCRPCRKPGQRL